MAGPVPAAQQHAAPPSLLAELWQTRAWRLFPLLLAYMSGTQAGCPGRLLAACWLQSSSAPAWRVAASWDEPAATPAAIDATPPACSQPPCCTRLHQA